MRIHWILIGYLILVLGITCDLILSVYAYTINPIYFISHEINKGFIENLLSNTLYKEFFIQYGVVLVSLPAIMLLLHIYRRSYWRNILIKGFTVTLVLSGITRVCGGLTWYGLPGIIVVCLMLTTLILISLIVIFMRIDGGWHLLGWA